MSLDPGYVELENAVVTLLLAGEDPVLEALRAQYAAGGIVKRMFSGVGFFAEFAIPETAPAADAKSLFFLSDIRADLNGARGAAGFHIQVKNGRLKLLEGFSYEDAWPPVIQDFEVYYAYPAAVAEAHPGRDPKTRLIAAIRDQWQK